MFKQDASAAASEFSDWVKVGIYVYIFHGKYQVKPQSSPWFSTTFAVMIVHRNLFFVLFCFLFVCLFVCLYQQNKSFECKG